MKKRFGTALNCIDGRTQIPVIRWVKENFGVDYVDMITEPGMDRVLSQGPWDEIESLRNKVIISIPYYLENEFYGIFIFKRRSDDMDKEIDKKGLLH